MPTGRLAPEVDGIIGLLTPTLEEWAISAAATVVGLSWYLRRWWCWPYNRDGRYDSYLTIYFLLHSRPLDEVAPP